MHFLYSHVFLACKPSTLIQCMVSRKYMLSKPSTLIQCMLMESRKYMQCIVHGKQEDVLNQP